MDIFHFMFFLKDMFREFGLTFCVSEVFPMFFKSCVEVSVFSSYLKFLAVGACQFINPFLSYLLYCSISFEITLFSLLLVL